MVKLTNGLIYNLYYNYKLDHDEILSLIYSNEFTNTFKKDPIKNLETIKLICLVLGILNIMGVYDS